MGILDNINPFSRQRRLERKMEKVQGEIVTLTEQRDVARKKAVQLAAKMGQAQRPSGVEILNGKYIIDDNSKFRGVERYETIQEMMLDPHVYAIYERAVLALVRAEWKFEPASQSAKDLEIAELCDANLLCQGGEKYGGQYWCQAPWKGERLPAILDMLPNGFSMFNKTWRVVGSKRVFDRLHYLEPKSVDPYGWKLDEQDNLVSVLRSYNKPDSTRLHQEETPIEDLAIYPWNFKGARFAGESKLRSVYSAWMRKNLMTRWMMLYAQRVAAGYPLLFYPSTFKQEDKDAAEEFLQSSRGFDPERAYFMAPLGENGEEPKVTFMGSEVGEIDRMRSMINGENSEMAHGGGTKSQMAGEQSFGTRNTAETHHSGEQALIEAIGMMVCTWENRGVGNLRGLVQELVDENFGNVKEYPKLTVSQIDPMENTARAEQIATLVEKEVIPNHPEVQKQVARLIDLNIPEEIFDEMWEEKQREKEEMRKQMAQGGGGDEGGDEGEGQGGEGDEGGDEGEGDEGGEGLEALEAAKNRIAELLKEDAAPRGNFRRKQTVLEAKYVSLSTISATFNQGQRDILQVLREARIEMRRQLLGRFDAGLITVRNLPGQRASKFKGAKRRNLLRRMISEIDDIGEFGVIHVADELKRQRGELGAFGLKGGRVAGARLTRSSKRLFDGTAQTVAEITLDKLWRMMLDSFLDEFDRLQRQDLPTERMFKDLGAHLDDLSDKRVEDWARQATHVAYNEGRSAAMVTAKGAGAANYAVRSEILDDRTCANCRAYDGKVVEIGSAEYREFMPPAKCLGGDRCRGFYVVLSNALTEAS